MSIIDRLQDALEPSRDLDWEIHCRNGLDGAGMYGDHPRYTSSFDDALRLVPDKHDWIVGDINGQIGGTPYACVGSDKSHYAGTAVMSLCLAALRAEAAARIQGL